MMAAMASLNSNSFTSYAAKADVAREAFANFIKKTPSSFLYRNIELSWLHYAILAFYCVIFFVAGSHFHSTGANRFYAAVYMRAKLPKWVLSVHVGTLTLCMVSSTVYLIRPDCPAPFFSAGEWVRVASGAVACLGIPTIAMLAHHCSGPKNAMLALWTVIGSCVGVTCLLTILAPSPVPSALPWAWTMILNGFTVNRAIVSIARAYFWPRWTPEVIKWSFFFTAVIPFAVNGALALQGHIRLLGIPSFALALTIALFDKIDFKQYAHASSFSTKWELLADDPVVGVIGDVRNYARVIRADSFPPLNRE